MDTRELDRARPEDGYIAELRFICVFAKIPQDERMNLPQQASKRIR